MRLIQGQSVSYNIGRGPIIAEKIAINTVLCISSVSGILVSLGGQIRELSSY